jgi:hypothetical protein
MNAFANYGTRIFADINRGNIRLLFMSFYPLV